MWLGPGRTSLQIHEVSAHRSARLRHSDHRTPSCNAADWLDGPIHVPEEPFHLLAGYLGGQPYPPVGQLEALFKVERNARDLRIAGKSAFGPIYEFRWLVLHLSI